MCAISFEKVYTVLPVFRAEKFEQPTHLNEVRQMDIEQAFSTDEDVMKVLEEFLAECIKKITESSNDELEKIGQKLEPWHLPLKRVQYRDALERPRQNGEDRQVGDDMSKTQ